MDGKEKIVELDNFRPHIRIALLDGRQDVFPEEMIESVIDGRLSITDIDEWEILMRSILKDWLRGFHEQT